MRVANFFIFKSGLVSHGQLSPGTISEKTNDPILRKFGDGGMDRGTDGQTDRMTDKLTD